MALMILRSDNYRRMRWKNGLGETAEVAIAPHDAALDAFDWRISMARVESDGPFSPFAGIDRTLSILQGEGLCLVAAGGEAVTLSSTSAPYSFRGDVACDATLAGGPVTDLNVMTRRDRCWHRVRRVVAAQYDAAPGLAEAFLVASSGVAVMVSIDGAEIALSAFDSVRLGPGPWTVQVPEVGPDALLLVEIGALAG